MTAEETYQSLRTLAETTFGSSYRLAVEQAAAEHPDHAGIQALAGSVAFARGDVARARDILAPFETFAHPGIAVGYATILISEGKVDEALAMAKEVLNRQPDIQGAHQVLLTERTIRGDKASIESLLASIEAQFPNHASLMLRCQKTHLLMANKVKAERILDRFRGHASGLFDVAEARSAMERHDWFAAETLARQAIEKNDEYAGAFSCLAFLMATKGELDEAKRLAYHGLDLDCRSASSLMALALVARLEQDVAKAKEFEERAEALSENQSAYFEIQRASRLFAGGQIEESFAIFRGLIYDPVYLTQRRACENVLKRVRSIPEATKPDEWFREIGELGYDGPVMYSAPARVASLDRKLDVARDYLDRGLAKYPHDLDLAIAKLDFLDESGDKAGYTAFAEQLFPVVANSPMALTKVLIELAGHGDDALTNRYHERLQEAFPKAKQYTLIHGLRDIHAGQVKKGFEKMDTVTKGFEINREVTMKYAKKRVLRRMSPWRRLLTVLGLLK